MDHEDDRYWYSWNYRRQCLSSNTNNIFLQITEKRITMFISIFLIYVKYIYICIQTRMHSSTMCTARPLENRKNHACPPKKPCMPPSQKTTHPPKKNHTCPPEKNMHPLQKKTMHAPMPPKKPCTPPGKKTCMPPKKPCMPPKRTTHNPHKTSWSCDMHAPPCGQTHTCKNITFANFVCWR